MGKIRVEWPTEPGEFRFVMTQLRTSHQGNPYFFADGPFEHTHVFIIQENGDIMTRLKGSKRGAWVKVGQRRESFNGTTYYLGPDDELSDVERRDLNNPMAQQWKKEHEELKRGKKK